MIGHIFALVRVGTWEYKRSKMLALHNLSEGFNSLIDSHLHLIL